MSTPPKPLTAWQEANTPGSLPRHIRRDIAPNETGCWQWTRSLSRDGYGWASLNDRTCQAHRLVYELLRGAVPDGLILDHICRNRACVNPDHLEPVTPRENLLRSSLTPAGAKVCARCGGEFSMIGKAKPQRRCLPCADAWRRQYSKKVA